MKDFGDYVANKHLETISVELAKQVILEDMTLSPIVKRNWISVIDAMSTAKNMTDICTILAGQK